MATDREKVDRFLSGLDMNYDRTGQRCNDNGDRSYRSVPAAPLASTMVDRYHGHQYTIPIRPRATPTTDYRDSLPTRVYWNDSSTIYDRYPKRHDTISDRHHATSTTDHHGSRRIGSHWDFPAENTTVGQRDLEARRGRGRSKSRSPIRDSHRPRREASWDHEWVHDRYRHRDAGLPRHGEASRFESCRSPTKQKTLPAIRADTRSNTQSKNLNARQGREPSTRVRDDTTFTHQNPIMLGEQKSMRIRGPLYGDESYIQENLAAQKFLVDTNKKVQPTGLKKEQQSAGEVRYSLRAHDRDTPTHTALSESVNQARLVYSGREPQIGKEPVCGIDSRCQDGLAKHEITARPTEDLEATVARLQRVMTNMHAEMAKLKRRDNLFASISHRRKLWLNEIDLRIGHDEEIMRDAVALQAIPGSDKLRQQKTISHSQQCLNIKNDIRTRMERTIIETIRKVVEKPKTDFLSDAVSEDIMNALHRQKAQMMQDMEQRIEAKMQAFTDQERGKLVREMQDREAKRGGSSQDGYGSFLSQKLI